MDAEPRVLLDYFKTLTSTQANKLIEPVVGSWMRVRGSVTDVDTFDTGHHAKDPGGTVHLKVASSDPYFSLGFSSRHEVNRLKLLQKGQEITVAGRIDTIEDRGFWLRDCELGPADAEPVHFDLTVGAAAEAAEREDRYRRIAELRDRARRLNDGDAPE